MAEPSQQGGKRAHYFLRSNTGAEGLSHAHSTRWEGSESGPVQSPNEKASADQPLGLGHSSGATGPPVDPPNLSRI